MKKLEVNEVSLIDAPTNSTPDSACVCRDRRYTKSMRLNNNLGATLVTLQLCVAEALKPDSPNPSVVLATIRAVLPMAEKLYSLGEEIPVVTAGFVKLAGIVEPTDSYRGRDQKLVQAGKAELCLEALVDIVNSVLMQDALANALSAQVKSDMMASFRRMLPGC